MKPPRNPTPSSEMPPPSSRASKKRYPDRVRASPASTAPAARAAAPQATPSAAAAALPRTTHASLRQPIEDVTPRAWTECFDGCTDLPLPSRGGVWRVYDAGLASTSDLALVLLHGGGHCALSWGLIAEKLKLHVAVVAFDARGHGHSRSDHDADLAAETLVQDAAELVRAFFARKMPGRTAPRLVICGHSMGGAIAVRLAAAKLLPQVVGLVVIDVVEGTAMSALPYMASWLRGRTSSFKDVEGAIRYVTRAGHVKNAASARLSVPAQVEYRESASRWVWRTDLESSERYWKGWFSGLSPLFLSVPAAKMLVLANVDRLDKDLMIAQMQGKFQNILIPAAGHTVHEDQPEQTAQVIIDYLHRNQFLSLDGEEGGNAIFQQRSPIPPCY